MAQSSTLKTDSAATLQKAGETLPGRGALVFILMTTFLNLAGLGIINPVAPFVVGQFVPQHNVAFVVALIITAYSLSQFIAVPVLGALSDRYGRKPILLLSLAGSALGYLIYGIGGALLLLFLGRIIDGLTGGNIAIIQAYAADVTKKEDRARFFGVLGAAAGMGFVVGPALGGLIYRLADSYAAPVYVAALVTLVNTLWGLVAMPESLAPEKRAAITLSQLNPFTQLVNVLRFAHLRRLFLATFIWAMAFAFAQSNFSTLAQDRFGWSLDAIGIGFLIWGVVSIIVQAGLLRRLLPRFGEFRLALAGLVIMATGFMLVGTVAGTGLLLLAWPAIIVMSFGNALATPTLTALLSQAVGESEQGRVQAGGQAVQALARVVGPLLAGWTYQQMGAASPYLLGGISLVVTLFILGAAVPVVAGRPAHP